MRGRSKRHFGENDVRRRVKELRSVEADADFRKRLRSAFVEGRIGAEHPQIMTGGRERPRIGRWRWMVPVTAAAVLLVAIITLNRAPTLQVLQVTGQGAVRVDGHPIELDDMSVLSESIHAEGEIETPPDVLIDLLAEDVLLLEVTGGTHLSIPKMPGRWFGRAVACSLRAGELRIKTGKRFPGSELLVFTPEGRVEISGTLLSIQRDSGGTCVCVLEGIAYVGINQNDMQPVEPGYRKVMLRDGTVEIIPVKPMHQDGVLDFDKRVGHQIGHGK